MLLLTGMYHIFSGGSQQREEEFPIPTFMGSIRSAAGTLDYVVHLCILEQHLERRPIASSLGVFAGP